MVNHDAFVGIKINSALKREIEKIAEKIGVSTSKYVRARLLPAVRADRVTILGRTA